MAERVGLKKEKGGKVSKKFPDGSKSFLVSEGEFRYNKIERNDIKEFMRMRGELL